MALDYLGGLSVLTTVLTSERWRRSDMRAEARVMQLLAGAITKESRQLSQLEKART